MGEWPPRPEANHPDLFLFPSVLLVSYILVTTAAARGAMWCGSVRSKGASPFVRCGKVVSAVGSGKGMREGASLRPSWRWLSGHLLSCCVRGRWLCLEGVGEGPVVVVVVVVVSDRTIWNSGRLAAVAVAAAAVLQRAIQGCFSSFCCECVGGG